MNESREDFIRAKEEILRKLDELNENITREDIKNASEEELAQYIELRLEILKRLQIIEALEKSDKL